MGEIYPEREDTELLRPFARAGPGRRVLDLGTGNGLLALESAASGSRVVATDLNPHALRELRRRAGALGLGLEAVRTDLARGLGRFDRVLANPPYLPTRRRERDPDRWTNLALDGGPDGCRVLARILGELPEHLVADGRAFVLVSTVQRTSSLGALARRWRREGGSLRVVAERNLEGERLSAWELGLGDAPRPVRPPLARRGGRLPRGSGARPPSHGRRRTSTSPEPGPGRTTVPDGA